MYDYDNRVVITLDAGGTNLVFGAMQANKFIVDPITLPSNADNLDKCLATMVEGFRQIMARVPEKPVAISFAFPGPADYPNGIIGGYLPNFPSFRDGVALGPFLEAKFGIPVFINNDGDLFAFGEALGGALPEVNARLEALGSSKRYKNLLGYTFGTGFGIGMVIDNRLNRGDNSCVETFCLRHKKMPDIIVEDGVAVRAIKRVYGELTGNPDHGLEPKDICEIADGTREGDAEAAKKAFAELGEVAGDAMATAVTLVDGLIVIGGGMTYTFAAAQGGKVGGSICEPDMFPVALEILELAKQKGVQLVMSPDALIADAFSADANTSTAPANDIPDGWEGVDIADEGKKIFREHILGCKTILWNGPVGVFEIDKFATGSKEVALAIAEATKKGAYSLIGGGDSVACINKFGLADQVSYISTGGGALLEYIEFGTLPGVDAIRE